jgi:hypothetical protein
MKIAVQMNNESQMFRFCCSCAMVSLIEQGKCFACGGDFIYSSPKDDLHKRPKKYEKTH